MTVGPQIRPATPTDRDAAAFAELTELASTGIFGLLLGSRAERFLRSVFVLPGHELSYDRAYMADVEGETAGMLVAASGKRRRLERSRTSRVVLHHAGLTLPRMGIVAVLLTPVLRLQNEVSDDELYVQMVAVEPRHRRMGIGAELMRHAESVARETECRAVVLDVEETNIPAISLYRRLGFDVERRSKAPWIVDKPPVLRMVKPV